MRIRVEALMLVALLAVPALGSAEDRGVAVVNQTGSPITSLFISLVETDDWEDNVLGVDVLEDGESVLVTFSGYDTDQCSFDVLATNEDDDAWLLPDIDLCSVTELVITSEHIQAR